MGGTFIVKLFFQTSTLHTCTYTPHYISTNPRVLKEQVEKGRGGGIKSLMKKTEFEMVERNPPPLKEKTKGKKFVFRIRKQGRK